MAQNESKSDYSGYAVAFSFITLAGLIYIIPEEYLFQWSKSLATLILMVSSVFFAYSIEEMLGNKKIFDNFAVAMALFYIIYGIVLLLKYFSWLNAYTVFVLMILSIIPMYGFFFGILSLISFLKNNIRTRKGKSLEILLKLIPAFLPVINLILKVLNVI